MTERPAAPASLIAFEECQITHVPYHRDSHRIRAWVSYSQKRVSYTPSRVKTLLETPETQTRALPSLVRIRISYARA
jgi:hypothetical protein